MRVGLLVENAAPFVTEEVAALRAAGVRVRVASVFRPHPRARWETHFGGPVLYPRRGARAWARTAWRGGRSHAARLLPLARRARREGAPLRLVLLAAELARRVRREGWTHVHGSFATYPAWTAWAAARLAGIAFSFTGHAYDVQRPRPWLGRLVSEAAFVRAISRETAARLHAAAPSADARHRIRVSHLGVDVERFVPGADPPQTTPELLAVARLGPTKGLHVLVEAVARLHAGGRRVSLRLLGDGPERPALERRIAHHGLRGWVHVDGHASREDVARRLRRATLFVLPCTILEGGRHDGLPVALLEAMAAGCTVVTTPVGGIPDAVTDGRTGRLVAPGDPDALAGCLAELLAAPEARARLGRAARAEARRRFRLEAAAERLARWMDAS